MNNPSALPGLVQENIDKLAHLAVKSLEKSIAALATQDAEIADKVASEHNQANALLRIIEQECLETLEANNVRGEDLRALIGAIQLAAELDRIADHTHSIAKIVLSMDASDFSGPLDKISSMATLCQDMLVRAVEAYHNRDADLAIAAAAEDEQVNELDEDASSSLLMQLMSAPDQSMHATHLLWIAYHLERVGDHITHICERVVFVATGETPELVKH